MTNALAYYKTYNRKKFYNTGHRPRPISIPIKEKRIGSKIFYETDRVEFRELLRELQDRTVKINLSLSWNGVKRTRKRMPVAEVHPEETKMSKTDLLDNPKVIEETGVNVIKLFLSFVADNNVWP